MGFADRKKESSGMKNAEIEITEWIIIRTKGRRCIAAASNAAADAAPNAPNTAQQMHCSRCTAAIANKKKSLIKL